MVINELAKSLDIEIPKGGGFKEKFKAVTEKLSDKDVKLAKLEVQLPQVFWDLRHKVVHAGYEPNNEELNTIISWTLQILKKLEVLKPNQVNAPTKY